MRFRSTFAATAGLAAMTAMLGMAHGAAAAPKPRADAPHEAECPKALPAGTQCFSGQDMHGAYYWIARPKNWNGTLVVHAHGGPRISKPKPDDPTAFVGLEAIYRDTVDKGGNGDLLVQNFSTKPSIPSCRRPNMLHCFRP